MEGMGNGERFTCNLRKHHHRGRFWTRRKSIASGGPWRSSRDDRNAAIDDDGDYAAVFAVAVAVAAAAAALVGDGNRWRNRLTVDVVSRPICCNMRTSGPAM